MIILINQRQILLLSLVIITSLLTNTPLLAADLNDDSSGHAVSNETNRDGDDWGDDDWSDSEWGDEEEEDSPIEINHTVWAGSGWFFNDNDLIDNNNSLLEARYRLEASGYYKSISGVLKLEVIADDVADETTIESREAYILFTPVSNIDIRAGRQILTWGTGDLFFLNDLFPKDWQSFFSGREMEYLKSPSDAIKFSTFSKLINLDIVWTPEFDPDAYLTGERFSFFNPMTGQLYAAPPKLNPEEPGDSSDSETAVRLYRNLGSSELAFYGYYGFNKQPLAFDPAIGKTYFPEWQVYGASARNPMAGGIGNIEIAWHLSMDDKEGQDPFIPNGEIRFLLGYEKEIISKLNLGLQYYLEHKLDYDSLISNSFTPQFEPEENRHVVSARLNYRTLQEKLIWSFFGFYSPTDDDYYLIPSITYRANDLLTVEAGANIFQGKENYTFFGQLEDNSNIFTRIKLSF